MAGAGGLHHRGLPDRRPGHAGVVVRAQPGLISEVHRRTLGSGPGADGRELLGLPPRHGLGVGLPGPPQRPLRRQTQGAQQPAHADRRERDLELAADQGAHHVPGPQRELELVLTRVRPHDQGVQGAHLLAGQLRRPARHRPRPQRVAPALAELRQPAIDRAPRHPQRGRHVLGMHPRLHRVHRPQPHLFHRPVIRLAAVVVAHYWIIPKTEDQVSLLTFPLVNTYAQVAWPVAELRNCPIRNRASSVRGLCRSTQSRLPQTR